MAQTNYTPISLYYSTTASATPSAGNLVNGELAINITDGKLYYKSNAGAVTLLASAAGASGDVVGPSSATDNALVRFDTTTGKLVQNSVGILSDAGVLTGLTGLTSSGAITLSSLTSGRVTYAGTAGLLQDSANLTFNGTTLTANALTVSNAVTFSGGTANGVLYLNGSKVATSAPSGLAFDGTNLGITNASPTYKLDIYNVSGSSGGARIYGNDQSNVRLRLENSGSGGVPWDLVSGLNGISNAFFSVYNATLGSTALSVDATTNNVGIGATPNTAKLYVYQGTAGNIGFTASHVNGNTIQVAASYNYYDAYNHIFRSLAGSTTYATILNTGEFCVNTVQAITGSKISVENAGFSAGSSANSNQTNLLLSGYGYRSGATTYGNTSIRSTYNNSNNSASLEFYTATSGTSTAEVGRFTSTGQLLVNASSTQSTAKTVVAGDLALQGIVGSPGDAFPSLLFYNNNSSGFTNASITATVGTTINSGNIIFNTNTSGSFGERVRINQSGYVGIGTNNPANPLVVSSNITGVIASFTNQTSADFQINLSSGVTLLTPSTSILSFGTANTERMRLDATNGLQIGTSAGNSGANGLHVVGAILQGASGLSQQQLSIYNGNSIQSSILGVGYYPLLLNPLGALVTVNNTTGAQLINESSLNVNSTGNTVTFKATSAGDGSGIQPLLLWNSGTSGNNGLVAFFTETSYTSRGTITYNRGAGLIAYNTTSDYRAKDIFGPVTNSGELIDSTPVYMGKMKGATLERPMFIAHETPAYAHSGEKDAVDEDGNPVYQTMDNSVLVPVMWAEIQSLRKRLAAANL